MDLIDWLIMTLALKHTCLSSLLQSAVFLQSLLCRILNLHNKSLKTFSFDEFGLKCCLHPYRPCLSCPRQHLLKIFRIWLHNPVWTRILNLCMCFFSGARRVWLWCQRDDYTTTLRSHMEAMSHCLISNVSKCKLINDRIE